MRKGFIKKGLLALIVLVFTAALAVAATPEAPATINLKDAWGVNPAGRAQKAVILDHALHQAQNTCTDCHETDQGGKWLPEGEIKGMNDKNGAHKYCWTTCHVEKKVAVGKTCTKCHTKA